MLQRKSTPLPLTQITILMIVRLAEPINYTSLFPYINQQIGELGIATSEDRVGYYSGIVEAVFAGVQLVYHWAKLSDTYGRKPIILIGLTGVAISSSLYGFSRSFWALVLTRCLCGALNGNVAVVRAAVCEITDESNAPDAFALYGLVWIIGSILGNAIGGYLSHPVERYPTLFHPSARLAGLGPLFKEYPYLAPCLVTTIITLCGLGFGACFLKETHEGVLLRKKRIASDLGERERAEELEPLTATARDSAHGQDEEGLSYNDNDAADDEDEDEDDTATLVGDPESPIPSSPAGFAGKSRGSFSSVPSKEARREKEAQVQVDWGLKELLAVGSVRRMLMSLFLQSFIGGGWAALILLYSYTPTFSGGLGLTPSAIGTALSIQGVWSVVCQVTFLSRIQRRLGSIRAYQRLNSGWVVVFLTLPLVRWVAVMAEGEHAGEREETRSWWLWAALLTWLAISTVVSMSFSVSMVVVQLSCPDKRAVGGLNGVSTCVQCLSRVIGPWLVSSVFALSIDQNVLGGNLWWIFMAAVSVVSVFVSFLLEDKSRMTDSFEMNPVEEMEESRAASYKRASFEGQRKVDEDRLE